MASPGNRVPQGGPDDLDTDLDGISQADQGIRQLGGLIKTFNPVH